MPYTHTRVIYYIIYTCIYDITYIRNLEILAHTHTHTCVIHYTICTHTHTHTHTRIRRITFFYTSPGLSSPHWDEEIVHQKVIYYIICTHTHTHTQV